MLYVVVAAGYVASFGLLAVVLREGMALTRRECSDARRPPVVNAPARHGQPLLRSPGAPGCPGLAQPASAGGAG